MSQRLYKSSIPITTDQDQIINTQINGPYTAFGEFSTSQLSPIVQITFVYNINNRLMNSVTSGSASITASNSMCLLQSGTTLNSNAQLSTRQAIKYRAGQGLCARFTAIFNSPVVGTEQYAGLCSAVDQLDGLMFGYNTSGNFGILYKYNNISTFIPKTEWNGTAQPLLNPQKGNIYQIQLRYLGSGDILFWMADSETSKFVLVHTLQYVNRNILPSLSDPTLNMCYNVKNNSVAQNISLYGISCGLFIEGISKWNNIVNSQYQAKTIGQNTLTNILTIRNNSTYAGKTNKNIIFPNFATCTTVANRPATILIILNATLGGTPSYTNINTNSSCVSYDVSGTTVSGGTLLIAEQAPANSSVSLHLDDFNCFLVPGETLTIAVTSSATTSDIIGTLTWVEDI